jgi:hypothetical protein
MSTHERKGVRVRRRSAGDQVARHRRKRNSPARWTNLFVRCLTPSEAADRAEIYYRSIRPAGLSWRKKMK